MTTNQLFQEKQKQCYDLMFSRNTTYSDSWRYLSPKSVAELSMMKLSRLKSPNLPKEKAIDELMDVANYMMFALIMLEEK